MRSFSYFPMIIFCLMAMGLPLPRLYADEIVFIVHAQNPAETISAVEIRDYYFKRKRQWPDGTSVRFIDRSPDSEVRKIFLSAFLKKTSEDLELYWIGQKLYSGDSAPLKERTDAMTIQFVSAFKGAIGYISKSAPLSDKTVKTLQIK